MIRPWRTVSAIAAWTVVFLPPLFIAFLLSTLAVNVPFEDDWDSVSVATAARSGAATLEMFWQQHSEHRIVVPKLLIWVVSRLTGFNVVGEMIVGFLFVLATLWVTHRLLRSALESPQRAVVMTAVSSLLLFSLVQYEIWFSGTAALQLFFVNLCTVGLVWMLTEWPHRQSALSIAMGCAAAATFSEASGAVLWVTGAAAIAVTPSTPRQRNTQWMSWSLAAVVTLVVCEAGLVLSSSGPRSNLLHPIRLTTFVAANLGLPFSLGASPASSIAMGVSGCAVLALTVAYLHRRHPESIRSSVGLLLLAGHALLASMLIALGRSERGLPTAMLSHYAFVPAVFWIATFGMLAKCLWLELPVPGVRPRLLAQAVVMIAVVSLGGRYVAANRRGYEEAYARSRNLQMAVASMQAEPGPGQEVLQLLYPPDRVRIRREIAELRRLKLGPFAAGTNHDRAAALAIAGVTASAEGFVDEGTCESLTGWAWDPTQPDAPLALDLWTDGHKLGTVSANWFRRDLEIAGKGGGAHAFRFIFPEPLPLDTGRLVTVAYAGTSRELRGSPKRVMCRAQ